MKQKNETYETHEAATHCSRHTSACFRKTGCVGYMVRTRRELPMRACPQTRYHRRTTPTGPTVRSNKIASWAVGSTKVAVLLCGQPQESSTSNPKPYEQMITALACLATLCCVDSAHACLAALCCVESVAQLHGAVQAVVVTCPTRVPLPRENAGVCRAACTFSGMSDAVRL